MPIQAAHQMDTMPVDGLNPGCVLDPLDTVGVLPTQSAFAI